MNKIIKSTTFKFKNQKINFSYVVPYITSKITRFLKSFGTRLFCFHSFSNRQNFTQPHFLSSLNEVVSIYFSMKTQKQIRPKIRENLTTVNFNPQFTGI